MLQDMKSRPRDGVLASFKKIGLNLRTLLQGTHTFTFSSFST